MVPVSDLPIETCCEMGPAETLPEIPFTVRSFVQTMRHLVPPTLHRWITVFHALRRATDEYNVYYLTQAIAGKDNWSLRLVSWRLACVNYRDLPSTKRQQVVHIIGSLFAKFHAILFVCR